MITSEDSDRLDLPPSEQPPTDDPWVVVTPMPRKPPEPVEPVQAPRPHRARGVLCPTCGAYFPCEHDEA
jgi:hypothetical protein